jgi:hypothetical protein
VLRENFYPLQLQGSWWGQASTCSFKVATAPTLAERQDANVRTSKERNVQLVLSSLLVNLGLGLSSPALANGQGELGGKESADHTSWLCWSTLSLMALPAACRRLPTDTLESFATSGVIVRMQVAGVGWDWGLCVRLLASLEASAPVPWMVSAT